VKAGLELLLGTYHQVIKAGGVATIYGGFICDEEQTGLLDIDSTTNRYDLFVCYLNVQIKWTAIDEDVHRAQKPRRETNKRA